MHHIAIMKKSYGLIPKIIAGEKTIESRWYKHRVAPWGKISKGDTVWFKNSGEPVTARAEVARVLQFEDLSLERCREIYQKYGRRIMPHDCTRLGSSTPKSGLRRGCLQCKAWAEEKVKEGKRYCILIFLERHTAVEPFAIDKRGFGGAAAWLVVGDIKQIRLQKFRRLAKLL